MSWRDSAACLGAPSEVFFPPKGKSLRAARGYCDVCPVIAECRDWILADANGDVMGFVAGMTAAQRKRHRGAYKDGPPQSPCGTEGAYRRHDRHDEFCAVCTAAHIDRRSGRMPRGRVVYP